MTRTIKKISRALCISLVLGCALTAVGYASPGNTQAMISDSEAYRNIVGFEMAETTPIQNVITGCEGVFVSAVIAGHPASAAGLMVGDIITTINNFAVTTKSDALENMDSLDAGRSYPFGICRMVNGQVQKLTINILVEKVQEKAIGKIS